MVRHHMSKVRPSAAERVHLAVGPHNLRGRSHRRRSQAILIMPDPVKEEDRPSQRLSLQPVRAIAMAAPTVSEKAVAMRPARRVLAP